MVTSDFFPNRGPLNISTVAIRSGFSKTMMIELPTVELVRAHPLAGAVSRKNNRVSAGLNGSTNPMRPPQFDPLPKITESRRRILASGGRGKSAIKASTMIFVSPALIADRGP